MTEPLALLLLVLVCCLAFCLFRLGIRHPAPVFLLFWITLLGLGAALPWHLVKVNDTAASIIGVGVAAFVAPQLLRPPGSSTKRPVPAIRIKKTTFTLYAIVMCVALYYGLLSFKRTISAATGQDFDSLTPTQIRYTMTLGSGRGGGAPVLLLALAPLVVCMGILGALCLSKYWYILLPYTLFITMQSPGRTNTLAVVAAGAAFYLYVRPTDQTQKVRRRWVALMPAIAVLVGSVVYFGIAGNALGKTDFIQSQLQPSWVPTFLEAPLLYQVGGVSALSAATTNKVNPALGEHGRSIYLIYRAAAVIDPSVRSPDTITGPVGIPIPYNVYTAFGDVWLDYGLLGLGLIFGFFGAITGAAHRKATSGTLVAAWLAALLLSLALSSPITFRLFGLDTAAQIVVGIIVFRSVRDRSPSGRQEETRYEQQ